MRSRNLAQNLYISSITKSILPISTEGAGNDEFAIHVATPPLYTSGWIFADFASVAKRDLIYFHRRDGNTLYYYRKNRDLLGNGVAGTRHEAGSFIQENDVSEWINHLAKNLDDFGYINFVGPNNLSINVAGGYINYLGSYYLVNDTQISLLPNKTQEIIFNFGTGSIEFYETAALTGKSYYHIATIATSDTGISSFQDRRSVCLSPNLSAMFTVTDGKLAIANDTISYALLDTGLKQEIDKIADGLAVSNINPSGAATGQIIIYNGTSWVVSYLPEGSGLGDMTKAEYAGSGVGVVKDSDKVGGLDPTVFEKTENKNEAGGYAGLDENGKIDPTALPDLAINDVFTVDSQASMLALTAQIGDMAIRTDLNEVAFVLAASPASTLANWKKIGIDLSSLVLKTTTITINGTTYDLSQNRAWTVQSSSFLSNQIFF